MRYRYWEPLRSQPFHPPALALAAVDEAVVHPAFPALPELDYVRTQQVAAPVSGARDARIAQLFGQLPVPPVELVPFHRTALRRNGRGEPAVSRPAGEVGIRLIGRQPLDLTPDADLPVELAPVDDHCRPGARQELLPLRARVVAEETETVRPMTLEQNHPSVRRSIGIDGRQGHRLRQGHDGPGLAHPLVELLKRVIPQVLAIKGRVLPATRAHSTLDSQEKIKTRINGPERMPGAPVGVAL